MDLGVLHGICKKATREAYDAYTNYINNALFNLTSNVIDIELNHMKATISQRVNSKMYNIYAISLQQNSVIKQVVSNYINAAVVSGRKFAISLS